MKRVAVVTGAARGIGAATARALAAEKMTVALLDLDVKGASRVADGINAKKGKALAVQCDVSKSKSVKSAVATVEKELGAIGILVNNAGIGGPFHRVDEVSDDEWDQIISTNVKSVFLFARELLPGMKSRKFGRIVNISSVQGLFGAARSSTYVASKHAMIGYTRAIAAEWGQFGITCNAICPGYVQTAMGVQGDKIDNHLNKILAQTPMGRVATPEEIAALVVYLVGGDSGYMNGSAIVIDGGLTAYVGVS